MHNYCVIIAKSVEAEHRVGARLKRFVDDRLSFEPDELVLHRVGEGTFVFSASVAQRQLGIKSPAHVGEAEACLVGGLPTFERLPQYRPSTQMEPAAWVSELIGTQEVPSLHEVLGGSYSVVRATPAEVSAQASFCGYDSLFYVDNDRYAVVGNRAALVAAFQRSGAHSEIDAQAPSWVLSTTMILGTDTPWREVRRLPTTRTLTIRNGRIATRPVDAVLALPDDEGLPASQGSAIQGLVERFDWHLRTGVPFSAHLTGGKDSRMILALLIATGSIERVGEIVTNGSEENGDVIVARQIAAEVGLKNHVVREGAKPAVRTTEWRQHEQRFRFSPWKYDMYLTPYDGWGERKPTPSLETIFTGGGGELIRQKGIAPDAKTDPLDTIVDRFTNWYYRHDALRLLAPDVSAWQRDWIRDEVEGLIGTGAVNLQQSFYIEQRMANWGSAHLRNNGTSSVPALIDLHLARLMHLRADMADDLPYEILTRCAPQLRGLPFVNDEWTGRTAARAEADGVMQPPVSAAVTKSFPWQFALYRDHRDELLRECLPSIPAWDGIVSAKHVERLLSQPAEPFNSSHVKMLFGLLAGTNYLMGELAPERDFASTTSPLRLAGSEATTAYPWFKHRRTTGHRRDSSR
jgi:hypothetical protein